MIITINRITVLVCFWVQPIWIRSQIGAQFSVFRSFETFNNQESNYVPRNKQKKTSELELSLKAKKIICIWYEKGVQKVFVIHYIDVEKLYLYTLVNRIQFAVHLFTIFKKNNPQKKLKIYIVSRVINVYLPV